MTKQEVEVLRLNYGPTDNTVVEVSKDVFAASGFNPMEDGSFVYVAYKVNGNEVHTSVSAAHIKGNGVRVNIKDLLRRSPDLKDAVAESGFSLCFRRNTDDDYCQLAESVSLFLYGAGRIDAWKEHVPEKFVPHATKQMLEVGRQLDSYQQQAATKGGTEPEFYILANAVSNFLGLRKDYIKSLSDKGLIVRALETHLEAFANQKDAERKHYKDLFKTNDRTIATLEVAVARMQLTMAENKLAEMEAKNEIHCS